LVRRLGYTVGYMHGPNQHNHLLFSATVIRLPWWSPAIWRAGPALVPAPSRPRPN